MFRVELCVEHAQWVQVAHSAYHDSGKLCYPAVASLRLAMADIFVSKEDFVYKDNGCIYLKRQKDTIKLRGCETSAYRGGVLVNYSNLLYMTYLSHYVPSSVTPFVFCVF